jgi:DNA-binding CsgD family transcriptional regulator/tetratricopeptide (TPR) repeat protein
MGPSDATGLLERDAELERLARLVEGARESGRVAFVSGAAGTGKSSLLAELRRTSGGITVRAGRCDALSTPAPLGPLYEMLPTLPPEVTGPLAEGGRRELVFSELLAELSRRPNLLTIDDVHWADEATIDLLRYVARRIDRTRTALVVTFRDEEVESSHPLQALLGEVAPEAERIRLQPLSVAAVTDLVADTDLDPLRVYSATGGNPFFVQQMVAHPEAELPPTVEHAVLARTRSLSPTAWEVLDAVSLSPEGLALDALARLSPTAEADADAAITRGLLVVDGGRVRASHDLVRLAVASAIPPARRRRTHRRLLGLLAGTARPTAADTATLAHHAVEAGDAEGIVTWCLRAAERAAADGAHREAAVLYRRVLEHEDLLAPDVLSDTLERSTYESYLTGANEEALGTASRAEALAASPDERGRHLRWLSRLSWLAGDPAAAERYARRAIDLLEETGTDRHELAYAYSNLAQLAALEGDPGTAETWGRQALDLAETTGDVEVASHALNNLGLLAPGRPELLERSLAIALEHHLEEHAARAYTNLSHHLLLVRELDRAGDIFDRGIAYTDDRDLETWRIALLDGRSLLRLRTGDWVRAEQDAEVVARLAGTTVLAEWATAVRARLAMRRGDEDRQPDVATAIATLRERGGPNRAVTAAALELERAWHRGDEPDARVVEPGVELAIAHESVWSRTSLLFWALRAGWDLPEVDLPPPLLAEVSDGAEAGAAAWAATGSVYEAALLRALGGDDDGRRRGVEQLVELAASGTLSAVRRQLAAAGLRDIPRGPNRATRSHPAGLTRRQADVLHLLVEGRANAEIAEALFISPKTVEHHVSAILAKLGASSRTEAVVIAQRDGLT